MPRRSHGEPLRILLVEDEPAHAELVMRSFEDHEIPNRIYHVSDGEQALNFLFRRGEYADRNHCPRPDVILLDLRLPRIDGLEVLKEIKADDDVRHIPVVILTSSEAEMDIAKAYDYHVNSYLVKPIDFDKFTRMMETLSDYWLVWNHA
ncbi:MAG: response regulator [Candidatus Krumholzibacteriota bacterium]|nr:response regulator [Candidatus Krumholzibacteriota bacterium]